MASQLRSPLREAHPNPSVPPPETLKPLPPQPQPQPLSPQSQPLAPQPGPLSPQPQPLPPLLPAPPEPNHELPPPAPPASIVNRAAREETMASVTKMEDGKGGVVREHGADRGSKAVSDIMRRETTGAAVRSAGLGLRLLAAVLTLISFSVMAADKTKGWAGDSFVRYREYRYCISVNVITFAYSSFQSYMHVHETIKGKLIMRSPTRNYFDLFMDQALAYLLISASSAAATRNDDWVTNWGSDPFTIMINGSLSVSFLAFVTVASSALISAYHLFSRDIK